MKKNKKILYIFPRIVDTVIQNTTENEIARSLGMRGYKVETVVGYKQEKKILDGFDQVRYIHRLEGLSGIVRHHAVMLKHMVKTEADVVLAAYTAMHLVVLARLLRIGRKHNPIWLMDIRSVPVDLSRNWRSRMVQLRYRLGLFLADRFCDGVTLITPALAESVAPVLKRLNTRIGIWESGVNLEHFSPEARSKNMRRELNLTGKTVLLYHGVMSPNRGLQNLILAFTMLTPRYPDMRLLLVGDGEGRTELQSLAERSWLADKVLFVDPVPYDQIGKYVASADIGVLPFPDISWWAVSSPIKLMEYLAMGLPVIATDITAIRHVVSRTGGAILAPDNRPESLAAAITQYLDKGCAPAPREILEDIISWNAQARSLDFFINDLEQVRGSF